MFKQREYQKNKNIYYNTSNKSHVFELRSRGIHIICRFIVLTIIIFFNIKFIVELLEIPISGIKLFQLSPDEYFIETIKISVYSGLILLSPFFLAEFKLFPPIPPTSAARCKTLCGLTSAKRDIV